MSSVRASIDPFCGARTRAPSQPHSLSTPKKVVIGNATLYHGNCFDVLPELSGIGAVVTDPPYGIGYMHRTYVDTLARYEALMCPLIP